MFLRLLAEENKGYFGQRRDLKYSPVFFFFFFGLLLFFPWLVVDPRILKTKHACDFLSFSRETRD